MPSVTLIFNVIGIVLATYSLSWGNRSAAFGSLVSSGRYLLNPEQRAKQIIKVTREASIEFCRGFWNLSELPPPRLFSPPLDVYQVTTIPMCGTLTLESKTPATLVPIPEPNVHGPPAPIPIRVLSSKHREGLVSFPISLDNIDDTRSHNDLVDEKQDRTAVSKSVDSLSRWR